MFSNLVGLAAIALSLATSATAYTTCKVPDSPKGFDDSANVRALLANCSTNAEIVFSEGKNYNISTPINFGTLNNVTISILGNLNLPDSIPYVQSLVNVTGSLYWFTIKVNLSRHEVTKVLTYPRATMLFYKEIPTRTKGSFIHTASNGGKPLQLYERSFCSPLRTYADCQQTLPLGGLLNRPHGMSL